MPMIDVNEKTLGILKSLSRKMGINKNDVLRIAVMELGNFYLNTPREVMIVERKEWEEFVKKLPIEIKEENAELLEKMVRDFGETTREMSECSKKRKEGKISLEEWIVESMASVGKAYETIKTIKPIVNEKIQRQINGVAREVGKWEAATLPLREEIAEKMAKAHVETARIAKIIEKSGIATAYKRELIAQVKGANKLKNIVKKKLEGSQ